MPVQIAQQRSSRAPEVLTVGYVTWPPSAHASVPIPLTDLVGLAHGREALNRILQDVDRLMADAEAQLAVSPCARNGGERHDGSHEEATHDDHDGARV